MKKIIFVAMIVYAFVLASNAQDKSKIIGDIPRARSSFGSSTTSSPIRDIPKPSD